MANITLNSSLGARQLSGEYDYLVESGSDIYYGDSQGVSASANIGTVSAGSTLSRRATSWVISAGISNLQQKDPAAGLPSSAVPSGAVETGDLQDDAVTQAKVADDAVGDTQLKYTIENVTVAAAATSGTATVVAGAVPLGILPASNQDQFVDNVAVSGTTLTVTLAAAATADNTFKVPVLEP